MRRRAANTRSEDAGGRIHSCCCLRQCQMPNAEWQRPNAEGQNAKLNSEACHSHSIVEGGLLLMSYTTRLMPRTSLTMRDEIEASRSCGRRAQSAVIPSRLSTARIATVYS